MIRARALRALAAIAALAGSGAAGAGEPERRYVRPPAAHPPPAGGRRVELHVRFPPWQFTGSFRLEGPDGAVLDEGVVRDQGGFTIGDGAIERVLEGSRGTLRLRLTAGAKTATFPGIFGRWEVAAGTGAWATTAGSGSFTSCSSGEPTGSPFELQTMIGYLVR